MEFVDLLHFLFHSVSTVVIKRSTGHMIYVICTIIGIAIFLLLIYKSKFWQYSPDNLVMDILSVVVALLLQLYLFLETWQ